MNPIAALAVYAAGVWVSWKYCAGYWIVGPVFAAEVLIINFNQLKKSSLFRYVLFAGFSTLIYALVFRIADKAWRLEPEWLDMLAGSMTGAVIIGSVLMTAVHAFLFETDIKTARKAALNLIVSWYVVTLLSILDQKLKLTSGHYYGLTGIAVWQGLYLYSLKLR